MKNTSMWALVLGFAAFAVVVCIDMNRWDWLAAFIGVAAVWSVLGCYWLNRKVFLRDLKLLFNCSSPLKCEWAGTFIFLGLVVLGIIAVVIAAMFFIVSQGTKFI